MCGHHCSFSVRTSGRSHPGVAASGAGPGHCTPTGAGRGASPLGAVGGEDVVAGVVEVYQGGPQLRELPLREVLAGPGSAGWHTCHSPLLASKTP